MNVAKVALVGFGTIGTGVARLLVEHRPRIEQRVGQSVELVRIVDKDVQTERPVTLPEGVLTDDIESVINDPEISCVIQLIGGLEPARTFMLRFLEAGKSVVTANKALLATHGKELFAKAREKGVSIAFEAAVAGGVPVIAGIGQSLVANEIVGIHGILNGTSNFILSQMEEQGADYAAAVAEAQRLGFAEADPTMDVDGTDAAQKLAILTHLSFGCDVDWKAIPRVGVSQIEPLDLAFAKELGYKIKLVAVAELTDGSVALYVSPTLVPIGTPLADVNGAYNAVRVIGDAVGRVFFHGLGAGQDPTASAVVADVIDTLVGRTEITFRHLNLFTAEPRSSVVVRNAEDVRGRFYLRLSVLDRPGVMAKLAGVLGDCDISIASLIQHESGEAGKTEAERVVPLVIMTHETTEGAVRRAVEAISTLEFVQAGVVRLRVRG